MVCVVGAEAVQVLRRSWRGCQAESHAGWNCRQRTSGNEAGDLVQTSKHIWTAPPSGVEQVLAKPRSFI